MLFAIFLLASCGGSDDNPADGGDPGAYADSLRFERSDGSVVTFDELLLPFCDQWIPREVEDWSLHVIKGLDLIVPEDTESAWYLKARIDDIVLGDTLDFPSAPGPETAEGVYFTVFDDDDSYASSSPGSSGWIRFDALTCGPGGRVEFAIDAVIGVDTLFAPELAGTDSLRVTGTFRSTVEELF